MDAVARPAVELHEVSNHTLDVSVNDLELRTLQDGRLLISVLGEMGLVRAARAYSWQSGNLSENYLGAGEVESLPVSSSSLSGFVTYSRVTDGSGLARLGFRDAAGGFTDRELAVRPIPLHGWTAQASGNTLLVAFRAGQDGYLPLVLGTYQQGRWSEEVVEALPLTFRRPSLAVAPDGTISIAVESFGTNARSQAVTYTKVGLAWQRQVLVEGMPTVRLEHFGGEWRAALLAASGSCQGQGLYEAARSAAAEWKASPVAGVQCTADGRSDADVYRLDAARQAGRPIAAVEIHAGAGPARNLMFALLTKDDKWTVDLLVNDSRSMALGGEQLGAPTFLASASDSMMGGLTVFEVRSFEPVPEASSPAPARRVPGIPGVLILLLALAMALIRNRS